MAKRLQPKFLQLGDILRPHGVRGELRVRVLTEYPDRLPSLKRIYLGATPYDPKPTAYTITNVRFDRQYALMTLKEIDDRDAADRLRGMALMVAIEDAVPLEEGEVYLFQLIGMRVVIEETGEDIGEIIDIAETGGNDNYIVKSEALGEFAIPAIPQVVLRIDTETQRVLIQPMDGLLPTQRPRLRKRDYNPPPAKD